MSRLIETEDGRPLPNPPRKCAVTGRAEGRFIDCNRVIDSPLPHRLYLSVEYVETIAREHLGMVSEGKAKQLEEWLEHARKERDELQEVIDAAAKLEEHRPDAVRRKEL